MLLTGRRRAICSLLPIVFALLLAPGRALLWVERAVAIDTDHDGTLDTQERAAWRERQRENYRQQAADRSPPTGEQH